MSAARVLTAAEAAKVDVVVLSKAGVPKVGVAVVLSEVGVGVGLLLRVG